MLGKALLFKQKSNLTGRWKQLGLSLILIFFLTEISGQRIDQFFSKETIESYTIKRYTNADGLKQNIIDNIFFDENDFLWMETPAGMVRFNGSSFHYYASGKGYSSRVQMVLPYSFEKNKYLVIFADATCKLIDDSELVNLEKIENSKIKIYNSYAIYSNGQNLLNTDVFSKIKNYRYQPLAYSIDDSTQIVRYNDTLFQYCDGYLEHFTVDSLLADYIGYEQMNYHFVFSDRVFSLRKDFTILEYCKQASKTINNDLQTLMKTRFPEVAIKRSKIGMYKHPLNKRAYAQINGSFFQIQYNADSLSFSDLKIECSIENVTGIDISHDKEHIFISTATDGLFHLRKNKFTNSISKDINTKLSVRAHTQTKEGDIYLSPPGIIHNDKFETHPCLENVNAFISDNQNQLYALTSYNLQKLNTESQQCYTIYHQPKGLIRYGIKDKEDRFWILQKRKHYQEFPLVLGELLKNSTFSPLTVINSPINFLSVTPAGIIQISGRDKIYYFDPENRTIDSIFTGKPLEIRDIEYLDSTTFLLSTYNDGLQFYQDGKISKIDIRNDKLNASSCIVKDSTNHIWVTTNEGLFRFSEFQVNKYIDNCSEELYYDYYGVSDGLVNNEFNGDFSPCAVNLNNGKISLPTIHGLTSFNPSHFTYQNKKIPKIILKTTLDNKYIIDKSQVKISPTFQRIEFELFTPNYGNSQSTHLYFMLDGFDESWNLYSTQKRPTYTRLKPGKYVFKYKRLVADSTAEVVENFRFTVAKNWYQTHIARILGILFFSLLLYSLFKHRVRLLNAAKKRLTYEVELRTDELKSANIQLNKNVSELRSTKQELTNLVKVKNMLLAIVSHEVVGGLQMIKNTSEIQLSLANNLENRDVVEGLTDINKTAKNTGLILNQILTWTKSRRQEFKTEIQPVDLSNVIRVIVDQLYSAAKENKIDIINKISSKSLLHTDKNCFLVVMHTLMENEIKHNQDCQLVISNFQEKGFDCIELRNNCVNKEFSVNDANSFFNALPNEQQKLTEEKGLGFWILKDILAKLAGKISFTRIEPHTLSTVIYLPRI